jgi:hypothetical protein
MRILRLTSAHRTCYLASAFLTVAALQILHGWSVSAADESRAKAPLTPPAPVTDVLDLVQTLKQARSAGLTVDLAETAAEANDGREAGEPAR